MEGTIVDLLAWRAPEQLRDFLLAWAERRSSTWADAARQALERGASKGHVPQCRGQLRFHLGETAVAQASRDVGAGCLPMQTVAPGATFMVARLGRFALVNQVLRSRDHLPRRSVTRRLLSQPNVEIDPQGALALGDSNTGSVKTELAYFGCLVTVPCRSDPTVPGELAIAVPSRSIDRWIAWLPLHTVHALLQNGAGGQNGRDQYRSSPEIPDRALPTFRVPKEGKEGGDNDPES